jgi:hypothetical protein
MGGKQILTSDVNDDTPGTSTLLHDLHRVHLIDGFLREHGWVYDPISIPFNIRDADAHLNRCPLPNHRYHMHICTRKFDRRS